MSVHSLQPDSALRRRTDLAREELLRNILTSHQPGDRLASEVELSKKLGVSRASVREALAKLAAEGVVERRWGDGTFVAPAKTHMVARLEELAPLSEIITRHGHSCEVEVVEVCRKSGPSAAHEMLEVPASHPIWSIGRVYVVDGERALHVQDFVPDVLNGKSFDASTVTQDLLPLLAREYGVTVTHAVTTLEPARPSAGVASQLRTSRGTVLLRIRQTAFASSPARPVIHTVGLSHPKRFAYTTLRRASSTVTDRQQND